MADLKQSLEAEDHASQRLHLAALHATAKVLTEAKTFHEASPRLLKALGETLGWDFATLWLVELQSDRLQPATIWQSATMEGTTLCDRVRSLSFARGEGLAGQAWQTGEPALSSGLVGNGAFLSSEARHPQRAHFFPLLCAGKVFGVLEFLSRDHGAELELRQTIDTIAAQIGLFVEKLRAEDATAKLRQETEGALRSRDEFLSIVSHQLKTPLCGLALRLQTLGLTARSQPHAVRAEELASKAETANRIVQRTLKMMEELLEVVRITNRRINLEPEQLDLVPVVCEVIDRVRDSLSEAGCDLTLRVAGPVVGNWDRLRLEQVVDNLLSNAIKYGRGKPIEITIEPRDDRVYLSVRDGGIGIPVEEQARIFERFERVVSTHAYSGLGLGLWIVRQILDAMGGSIEVKSSPGEGSTFLVGLPNPPKLGNTAPQPQTAAPDSAA